MVRTFSDLIMEVRSRLMRGAALRTREYRSFDRIQPFISEASEAWRIYRLARKKGVRLL